MVASAQLPSLPLGAPDSRTTASRRLQKPASSRASRPRRDMRIQALAPLTAVAATTATAAAALTVAMCSSKELRPTAKVRGCGWCTACVAQPFSGCAPVAAGGRLPPSPASRQRSALACRPPLLRLLQGQSTPWNSTILSLCPSLTAPYKQPSLLNNGHVETIFAAWFRWAGGASAGRQGCRQQSRATSPLPPGNCCSSCCTELALAALAHAALALAAGRSRM